MDLSLSPPLSHPRLLPAFTSCNSVTTAAPPATLHQPLLSEEGGTLLTWQPLSLTSQSQTCGTQRLLAQLRFAGTGIFFSLPPPF